MNAYQLADAVAKEIVTRWAVTDRSGGWFVPEGVVRELVQRIIQRMFEEELKGRLEANVDSTEKSGQKIKEGGA